MATFCTGCGVEVRPACRCRSNAEIAALKAEVERLRESEADLIQWIFDGGQRAGIEPADLSPTEVLTRMSDDLAAHKRALAAGPAALHYRSCDCCSIVEAAQAEAMKGGDVTDTIDSLRARLAEVERERDAVLWERNAIEDRLATAIAQSAEARGRLAEIEIEMRMMLPPGKTLLEILRERVAVRVDLGGDASPLADDDSLLRAQCALAACAEMREAAVGVDGRCRLCTARPREHRDNCALSRTDLGRWWASPEDTAQMVGALQMVEGDGEFDSLHEVTRKFVVDVLALIKKGGW